MLKLYVINVINTVFYSPSMHFRSVKSVFGVKVTKYIPMQSDKNMKIFILVVERQKATNRAKIALYKAPKQFIVI